MPVIQISNTFSSEKLFGVIVNRAPNDRGSHLEKMWSKLLVGAKEVSGLPYANKVESVKLVVVCRESQAYGRGPALLPAQGI